MKIHTKKNIISIIYDDEIINIINCDFIKNFIESIKIYTLLVEKDGKIIYACENVIASVKSDNIIGKKLSEVISNESYEELRKLILESIFTNKQIISEFTTNNVPFGAIVSPILDKNGNIKLLLIESCDMSKSKNIEEEINELKQELNESNSIKSIFLSNISHELRTPMNAIIGFSDILIRNENQQNTDQLHKYLKSIYSNAKHLDELLNNILDYSRLESNEFDILYENFSIHDIFDELYDIFEDVNYRKNLNFVKLEFIKNEDKKIISDYLRLKQVLFNLISNAIKFTENGYIRVSFSTSNNLIIFKVEDTGIGIPKDKIKFVFDRFWQCDSSSTKKYKGAGLGLSISKSIIELLGGEIYIESVLNKGTTCYVKLPLEEIKHEVLIENKNKINFSDKTILMIDDIPIDYSLTSIYFRSLHINIIHAMGIEAIKIYKQQKNKIDLICMDLSLSEINSVELLKELKKICNCKIICKSTSTNIKTEDMEYFIKKPIDKEKLFLILNEIWQK